MSGEVAEVIETDAGDYPEFYRLMTAHMRGEGPVPVDPLDSLDALAIVEAITNAQ